ncbi:MAG TPA: NAD(P)-dependent alcohol dehydrogenase [Acidobacteriota bacterium]|nr:NAD(P)-dependent alcohol dehydrogenase [Acidobacteriota bacterium]
MKAVVIRRYGSPDVLRIEDVPRPRCGEAQILVENHASSVNPVDWKIRRGYLAPFLLWRFPRVLGFDLCGRVVESGRQVSGFQPGDRVYARSDGWTGRAYAQFTALAASAVAPKPESLSVEEAAAVPLAALTALQALRDLGGLQAGQKVLVVGASGGVGHFAVQIAKALKARVTGVCGTRNLELVRDLGADDVIDYTQRDPFQDARRYHIVFDAVDAHSYSKSRSCLESGGRYITTLPSAGNLWWALWTALRPGKKCAIIKVKPVGEDLRLLNSFIQSAQLRPVIDSTFELEDIAQAHQRSESGHVTGKVVIRIPRPEGR